MECRKLGSSELELTTIGLGTWALGGDWQFGWGSQDDSESISTIHRALELGMNWLDTAAVYGLGRSEEVVGKALKDRRDHVIVATKCGLRWNADGSTYRNSQPDSLRQEIEDSLRRLQTDHIDLYQIHWPDLKTPFEESWATLASFVQEGKVRYIGVSNFSVEQMRAILPIHPIASLQPPYHLLDRSIEDEILPFCRENNIGVIAYSPMASGLLTGRFDITRVAENDWRRGDDKFQEPQLSRNLAFVEALRPIAARQDKTVAQLAVAWTLRDPVMTAAIVGARSVSQAEQIMDGANYRLSEKDLADIESAAQASH